MLVTVIPKAEQQTSNWSGGTTTQLYIYPHGSSYVNRDFMFRLSSAEVEIPESTFTKLPGVSRKIMVIDGELKLEHEEQHTIFLKKFETDSFSGDWNTKSFGIATDFNLMTTGNVKGSLQGKIIQENDSVSQLIFDKENFVCFYLVKGIVEITFGETACKLFSNDLSIFCKEDIAEKITLNAIEYSELVEVRVRLNQ